jgi:hypothetical protein
VRVLVTGGDGFICPHRLLARGHDVTVLDPLNPPVHRDGIHAFLNPKADFYQGDVRNRELMAKLLRRTDAVHCLAAYQDYLTDFARFGGERYQHGRAASVTVPNNAVFHRCYSKRDEDPDRTVCQRGRSLEGPDGLRGLAAVAAEGLRRQNRAAVGEAMKDSRALKRKPESGVTNEAVALAVEAGATGAKVTGAGGVGLLLGTCPPENKRLYRRALPNLLDPPVRLDRLGSRVVFNVVRDIWS